jgi:hypothetical protein
MRRVAGAAVIGGLAVTLTGIPGPASAAARHCKIADATTRTSYLTLSAAVNAASSGDTLTVRGTCTSSSAADLTRPITLTITGRGKRPTVSTNGSAPILSVVSSGAQVTLNGLVITGGSSSAGDGGGLLNFGTLTLNGTTVTNNTATDSAGAAIGGGIYNNGALTLNSSTVSSNTAASSGGGEGHGGGIYNDVSGAITLNNSSLTGNTAGGPSSDYGFGGGIYMGGGSVTLAGTSTITANTATGTTGAAGGGVYVQGGTLSGATAGAGGNVYGNTPDDIAP